MNKTKKNLLVGIFFFLICLQANLCFADSMRSPRDSKSLPYRNLQYNTSFLNFPGFLVIKTYRMTIGKINWASCPMYPHCSQYGLLAIEQHGIFFGSLMIFDRLHRCGHDLKNYDKIEVDKHIKFIDLVPE